MTFRRPWGFRPYRGGTGYHSDHTPEPRVPHTHTTSENLNPDYTSCLDLVNPNSRKRTTCRDRHIQRSSSREKSTKCEYTRSRESTAYPELVSATLVVKTMLRPQYQVLASPRGLDNRCSPCHLGKTTGNKYQPDR